MVINQADEIFKSNLRDILSQEWEVDNRARWKDGSEIKTKRITQVVNRYDLSKEFPALSLRPLALKACADEIIWIYNKQSNYVTDLNSSIWDSWAESNGSLGKAYAFQIAKPTMGYDNQVDYVLDQIKNNPSSRRLMLNMFDAEDMNEKALIECAYAVHFTVKNETLHTTLIQRSGDFLVANNWNVSQYAILAHMVARHAGLKVGMLVHFIQDLHIYNKHLDNALMLLERESFKAPTLWVNPDKKDFYSFCVDDFKLLNYEKHGQIKFEVAV